MSQTYSDRQPWMSDDQWRCAQLLAEVFGGFHHLPEFKSNGLGVRVKPYYRDLASYDFSHLTHLVILAHVRCIRVAVISSGMKLEVHAHPRDPSETRSMRGHAKLADAIARFAPAELSRAQAEERRLRQALQTMRGEAVERGDMSQFVETVDAILAAQEIEPDRTPVHLTAAQRAAERGAAREVVAPVAEPVA